MKKPLIHLTIAFMAGLGIGHFFNIQEGHIIFALLFSSLIISLLIILKNKEAVSFLFPIIFFLIGILYISEYRQRNLPPNHIYYFLSNEKINIEGNLYTQPEQKRDKTRLFMELKYIYINGKKILTTGRVLLWINGSVDGLQLGDRIRINARLGVPKIGNIPGGFDYQEYLALKEIFVTGIISSPYEIVKIKALESRNVNYYVEKLRGKVRSIIDREIKNPEKGIIKALLIGDRDDITEEINRSFYLTGLTHILSISGLHMGIVAILSYLFIYRLLLLSEKIILRTNITKISSLFVPIPVIFYSFLAGNDIPTQRSVIMVIAFLLVVLIDREKDLWCALALAGLLIVTIHPVSIIDISFQLSFLSVASILYFYPRIIEIIEVKKAEEKLDENYDKGVKFKIKKYIRDSLIVSISAIVGTTPFVAYYFGYIPIMSLLANLIVVPLLGTLTVGIGIISVFMSFFSEYITTGILYVVYLAVKLSLAIIEILSHFPFSGIRFFKPTVPEISAFYILLIFAINIKKWSIVRYGITLILIFFLVDISYWYIRKNYNNELRVNIINTVSSDIELIEFPKGERVLVHSLNETYDGYNPYKNTLAPFLSSTRINRVNYLLEIRKTKEIKFYNTDDNIRDILYFDRRIEFGSINEIALSDVKAVFVRLQAGELKGKEMVEIPAIKINFRDTEVLLIEDGIPKPDSPLMEMTKKAGKSIIKIPVSVIKRVKTEDLLLVDGFDHYIISGKIGKRDERYVNLFLERIQMNKVTIMEKAGSVSIISDGKKFQLMTYQHQSRYLPFHRP